MYWYWVYWFLPGTALASLLRRSSSRRSQAMSLVACSVATQVYPIQLHSITFERIAGKQALTVYEESRKSPRTKCSGAVMTSWRPGSWLKAKSDVTRLYCMLWYSTTAAWISERVKSLHWCERMTRAFYLLIWGVLDQEMVTEASAVQSIVIIGTCCISHWEIGRFAYQNSPFQFLRFLYYGVGLELLRDEAQYTVRLVDHACLAIIAFTAGAELHFDIIRRLYKQASLATF